MIRLSLISLLIAVLLGGVLLIHKAIPLHPAVWALLPVHFELTLWGWLVQFVMETAYWIFPRFMEGAVRGPVGLSWIMIISFNTGLSILIADHIRLFSSFNYSGLIGRGLIMTGLILFAFLIWWRIISYRKTHQFKNA